MNQSDASPLRVVTPKASTTPQDPIGLDSSNLLRDLLYPLSPDEFMRRDFRQRAVHIQASCKERQEDQESNGSSNNSNNNNKNGRKKRKQETTSRHSENRFQSIIQEGMYDLNTLDLVKETSSDSIFVWLARKNDKLSNGNNELDGSFHDKSNKNPTKQEQEPQQLVQSIEIPDAETAYALHQSSGSHALYCRAPPPVEQLLVSKLLRDTGLGCGQYDPTGESMTTLARGEVEMFITFKAGGTTGWHYDFQENFTLQLSGVKRWTLQRGTVSHPLRACTPHYRAPDVVESQLKAAHLSGAPDFIFDQPTTESKTTTNNGNKNNGNSDRYDGHNAIGPTKTATLYPGDVLYFPAGMWHKIDVLEPGVSINVSLMATNFANVTCQALQHFLLQRDEWRQVLVHNPTMVEAEDSKNRNNPQSLSLNALDHLKRLLKELPGIIKEFEQKHGGAEAILPPVLLQPPSFHNIHNDGGGGDDDSGDDDDDDDQGTKPPAKKLKRQSDDEAGSDNENEDSDDERGWEEVVEKDDVQDNNIVDACEFQYPSGYSGPCPIDSKQTKSLLSSHCLIRNPLASLLRMDEITRYYKARIVDANQRNVADETLFVLNINYGGVESHESSIRVVFRDEAEKRHLHKLYTITRKRHQSKLNVDEDNTQQLAAECPNLIHCLLYYGYYTLVPTTRKNNSRG